LAQRRRGEQQQAALGQVAEVADHGAGHHVFHRHAAGHLAPPPAAGILVVHAPAPDGAGSARPASPRSRRRVACQARSTGRLRSSVTTRAWPAAIIRASASSECSATFWPRVLTNSAWSVTGLYQDSRCRRTSPWAP